VRLESFEPADPSDVLVLVQILAGPTDGSGEESFDVIVSTPKRLEREVATTGPLIGRHYLIVPKWDWGLIRSFLTDAVVAVSGSTWDDVATKLARIGHWEFEDYQDKLPAP
jgi:hypothetical protein